MESEVNELLQRTQIIITKASKLVSNTGARKNACSPSADHLPDTFSNSAERKKKTSGEVQM
jgi:hypothetical protein